MKSRLSHRLTAVTIHSRGHNHTFFINLPIDSDGKVRITEHTYNALIKRATHHSGQRNQRICLGGVGYGHL